MILNLPTLCEQTCNSVASIADFINGEVGKVTINEIDIKSLNSLVSYVDKTAEEKLVAACQQILPEAGFITEEETINKSTQEYTWIIDPLDGTTNFLHQLPFFSISVALNYKNETILGVVYEVNRKECFYAWKDGGAFLNGNKISVNKNPILQNALIATGFPYFDYTHTRAYMKTLEYFMINTRGIRRLGSAALDLAYVACGRFDGYYEYSLSPWDVAAGAILVKEAGGNVTDFRQGSNYVFGKEIIATSSNLFEAISTPITENFIHS